MNSTRIKLSVIVLFYHGERWVDLCIQSLENQSLSRDIYEIIMVDNGGSTPSIKKYENRPNINILNFPINYGFAGGNNRALAHAQGEIVLLLNQDAVVHHNCLEQLLNTFNCYPQAGAVSASMLMVSSNDVVNQYAPSSKTVGLYRLTHLGYASYSVEEANEDIVSVDFVSGTALSFRRPILGDIGNNLFDDRLGSYMEDLDLSIRLRKTQWKMYVQPKAVVYHYRDEAFSGKPSYMLGKLIHVSSNRLMVYYNNLATADFLKKLPTILLGIPLKVSRLDENRYFNLFRFMITLGILPLILVYFGLKVLANIEAEKEKANISRQVQANNKKWGRYTQVVMLGFFSGIGLLFLYGQDWRRIYSSIQLFNWPLLAVLTCLTMLTHLVATLRTKLVFRRIGYRTRFSELFAICTTSQFSSIATPVGVGTLLAVPFLKIRFQIPLGSATFFTIADRLFGFYFLGCFALMGITCYLTSQGKGCVVCLPLLLFLAWLFFQIVRICDEAIHRFGAPEYGGKMLNHLGTDFLSQSAICFSKFFRYVTNIAQFLIITWGLNYSMDLTSGWMIISVSSLMGIISMIPMGLVSRDATIIALSSHAGVPASAALVTVLLLRTVSSLPTAILGTVCGLWLGRSISAHGSPQIR